MEADESDICSLQAGTQESGWGSSTPSSSLKAEDRCPSHSQAEGEVLRYVVLLFYSGL